MDPISEENKKLELKIDELKNLQKEDHKKRLKTLFESNIMIMEELLDKNKKVYETYEDEHIPWDSYKCSLHNIITRLDSIKRLSVKISKHI